MRLLTAILLSLMLTACGQSGALYFDRPESNKPAKQASADAPAKSTDKDSNENSDATTGP